MIFSRVVFSLLTLGAISAVATPTPVPVSDEKRAIEKRADVSDVLGVVSTLGDATGSILPQINSLISSATATADNITPLLQQLQTALNTAGTSIQNLESGFDASTGGSAQDVANGIAPIINDVVTTLSDLQALNTGVFGPLIASLGLDAALNTILVGLGVLLAGVLELVAAL
ncbi:hypothetical protein Clacol_006983 [Clathrus columnatus]|uniref:Uncharacterized protein n=1 Tax=Clathrus columnatus TaxID=1419009 RepID=A0AAV5AGX6_9AGAM|nr:hypothetical protein Clacol_006983 [Clathrus columnatus]